MGSLVRPWLIPVGARQCFRGGVAPTQELALKLVDDGYAGLLTRSFARVTSASNLNLVLWRWAGDGCSLGVVDDEGRLGRM